MPCSLLPHLVARTHALYSGIAARTDGTGNLVTEHEYVEFYVRSRGKLLGVARARLNQYDLRDHAEDVIHQVYWYYLEPLSSPRYVGYANDPRFDVALRITTRERCQDLVRGIYGRQGREIGLYRQMGKYRAEYTVHHPEGDLEGILGTEEAISAALGELSDVQRIIVTEHLMGGIPMSTINKTLKIRKSTLYRHLADAISVLRDRLSHVSARRGVCETNETTGINGSDNVGFSVSHDKVVVETVRQRIQKWRGRRGGTR